MRIRDGFCFKKIENDTYLLPCGQATAEFSKGMKLNASGEFIAFLLTLNMSEEKILQKMKEKYEASDEDLPILKEDLDAFIKSLHSIGVLVDDDANEKNLIMSQKEISSFEIAGLSIEYHGSPALIRKELLPFVSEKIRDDDNNPDQIVCVVQGTPFPRPIGNLLVRTSDIIIIENDYIYAVIYPDNTHVSEMHVLKDGSKVFIYSNTS